MKAAAFAMTVVLILASGSFGHTGADSPAPLLVPGFDVSKDCLLYTSDAADE